MMIKSDSHQACGHASGLFDSTADTHELEEAMPELDNLRWVTVRARDVWRGRHCTCAGGHNTSVNVHQAWEPRRGSRTLDGEQVQDAGTHWLSVGRDGHWKIF